MRSFFSPAKVNLFFRVLKKRSDGYHEIASLYQAIDLFDTLQVTPSPQDRFSSNIDFTGENLVEKAVRLFRARFPFSDHFHIHLEKKIPLQAGLGGGSSNAATTLWALNASTGHRAALHELIDMGATLGSDVPFFFSTGTAYCTGRGEIFEPFSLPSPLNGFLAKPDFGLSTPLVYQETCPNMLIQREPRDALAQFPLFYNDLEPAAFQVEPRLETFRNSLIQEGFDSVTMTGSGSAFFCMGNVSAAPWPSFRSIQRQNESWY